MSLSVCVLYRCGGAVAAGRRGGRRCARQPGLAGVLSLLALLVQGYKYWRYLLVRGAGDVLASLAWQVCFSFFFGAIFFNLFLICLKRQYLYFFCTSK
jgi:hypothetical protein